MSGRSLLAGAGMAGPYYSCGPFDRFDAFEALTLAGDVAHRDIAAERGEGGFRLGRKLARFV
jgi:hypothetical protein